MAHVEKFQAAALGRMCGHYERRAEIDHGYKRENIDNERSWLNYNLGPQRPESQVEFINDRIDSLNLKRRPRKDAVRMCDCVITMPKSFDPSRQREFFNAAYAFLSQRYGEENVVSAWVHRDEAMPHMHFAWVPVTQDGRLSAKTVVNRLNLKTLHPDMQVAMETALGCKVEILLDPEKAGEKQLSSLSQPEYVAAKAELARIENEIAAAGERLECVQQREQAARARSEELVREAYASVDECKGLDQQVVQLKAEIAESDRNADSTAAAIKTETGRAGKLAEAIQAEANRASSLAGAIQIERSRVSRLEQALERVKAQVRRVIAAIRRVPSAMAMAMGGKSRGARAFWRVKGAEAAGHAAANARAAAKAKAEAEKPTPQVAEKPSTRNLKALLAAHEALEKQRGTTNPQVERSNKWHH